MKRTLKRTLAPWNAAKKPLVAATTSVNKPSFGISLLGPLNVALEEKGEPILDPAVPGLEWEHPFMGRILVRAENFSVEEVDSNLEGVYGAVKFEGKPRELRVTIIPEGNPGVSVVEAWGGNGPVREIKKGRETIDLDVSVFWDHGKNGKLIPSSRRKHRDNCDIFFLSANGGFLQMQVSVCVRAGKMWLLMQEQYKGQVVRTTAAKADEKGFTYKHVGNGKVCGVVPISSDHAGPHGDFLTNFPPAKRFFEIALRKGAFEPLGKTRPAAWMPEWPELDENDHRAGREVGIISFFNGAVGFGKIVTQDVDGMDEVFVHFTAIMGDDNRPVASTGKLPLLERGQQVAFRRRENDRGNWEATVCKVL